MLPDQSCPNCHSHHAVICEPGEGGSSCPDCGFTWWQSENIVGVSREILERLAGSGKGDGDRGSNPA